MVMRNRIKECRQVAGMSQKELSNLVGIKDDAISRYETGTCEPRLEMWEKLATALNVSPTYLVGWSDESQRQAVEKQIVAVEPKPLKDLEVGLSNGCVLTITGTKDDPVSLKAFQKSLSKAVDDDGIWIEYGNAMIEVVAVTYAMEVDKDDED